MVLNVFLNPFLIPYETPLESLVNPLGPCGLRLQDNIKPRKSQGGAKKITGGTHKNTQGGLTKTLRDPACLITRLRYETYTLRDIHIITLRDYAYYEIFT